MYNIFVVSRWTMIIDVSDILKNEGAGIKVEGEVNIDFIDFSGMELKLISPISVIGDIRNIGGNLYLNANGQTKFVTECARCLDDVNVEFAFPIEQIFSNSVTDDVDIEFIESGTIELDEIIESQLCMNLPMSYLCKEDCKGLCAKCGCNLNISECDCDTEEIDPRLLALKDFLKE